MSQFFYLTLDPAVLLRIAGYRGAALDGNNIVLNIVVPMTTYSDKLRGSTTVAEHLQKGAQSLCSL